MVQILVKRSPGTLSLVVECRQSGRGDWKKHRWRRLYDSCHIRHFEIAEGKSRQVAVRLIPLLKVLGYSEGPDTCRRTQLLEQDGSQRPLPGWFCTSRSTFYQGVFLSEDPNFAAPLSINICHNQLLTLQSFYIVMYQESYVTHEV